ncbi:hypothetical protein BDQ12DRAFT_448647 [Crucibulum laeve]|uniref:Glycosyltransferase 61 catalytic domain-containing protein n=1 Tax=Crucibulum laeve TaxID=68775 RepID=A0A5C3LMB3_9AGAR|nr:hypothetical protein BDQ12DRAFT_448647 [Crucibulum laeve]
MMLFRHALSRRDAFLILLGASSMHIWSLLFRQVPSEQSIVINTHLMHDQPGTDQAALKAAVPPPPQAYSATFTNTITTTTTRTVTRDLIPTTVPAVLSSDTRVSIDVSRELPHTSIVAHAPGWTLFRNLYMSNGTLFVVTDDISQFPEIRMMTSTGLAAVNTPENIAAREPTKENMDFLTPEQAQTRWGGDVKKGEKNRVWSIEGNTLLFNDPSQFLRHYYHFVAELFFGVQAFWHGAFSKPTSSPSDTYALVHPSPPPVTRAIFTHSNADGWRDGPGFNAYFLRGAFPSLTVEMQEDWDDRIATTRIGTRDRAWHFPLVLLTDRSAAHRGTVCGSQTQRTAAEAWSYMKDHQQLQGMHVGGWWEPVRSAIWRFSGSQLPMLSAASVVSSPNQELMDVGVEAQKSLGMPEKVVVTYISRQGVARRKLIAEDHAVLVAGLKDMADRRGWELNVLQAEKMTKDEQVQAAAKTTILLGVHGNGLTHLVWMPPTRASTVIEMFYPEGFAHDYQWTTRALGMSHFAVWNDTHRTYPNKPEVNYPEGFQGNEIPVYAPTIIQLIEDRVDGKI